MNKKNPVRQSATETIDDQQSVENKSQTKPMKGNQN